MDVNQEIIPHVNQMALDYANHLDPCYRFCPTDSELILHCLIPKIESRNLPRCQLHEVDIYNHNPDELAERYLCGQTNKWYFLTRRKRMYASGDRPKRGTRDFGTWKATQCKTPVYNDANEQMIGYKASLAFHDNHGKKTTWLMHEYTTDRLNNTDKFNDWALCTIYKHETKKTANGNRGEVIPINQEDAIKERNCSCGQTEERKENCYGASPKRQRASNTHESHIAYTRANSYPYPITMQPMDTNQNRFTSAASNSYQFTNGASSSYYPPAQPLDTSHQQVLMENYQYIPRPDGYDATISPQTMFNNYQFTNAAASSSYFMEQPAAPAQHGGYTAGLAPNSNNFLQNPYEDSGTLGDVLDNLNESMVVPQYGSDASISSPLPDYSCLDDILDATPINEWKSICADFPTLSEIDQCNH